MKNNIKGFTLIELSIVIVIIGLIVSGIVGGQSLLKQAQLRSVVSESSQYKQALASFKLEYNGLPGDFKRASMYWPSAVNGDGDKKILYAGFINETIRAWKHLSLSGLVPGSYDWSVGDSNFTPNQELPASKYNGGTWWLRYQPSSVLYQEKEGNFIEFSAIQTGGFPIIPGAEIVTASEAHSIDIKIDDGLADEGDILTLRSASGNIRNVANACVTESWTEDLSSYVLTDENVTCRMLFRFPF